MASLSPSTLQAILGSAPPSSRPLQNAPWTAPTPDRLLRTTAVPVLLEYGSDLSGPKEWNINTATYNAVSPPDPTTGQRYFCLIPGSAIRYDYSLNRAVVAEVSNSQAGEFSAVPLLGDLAAGAIATYCGWAYAIDAASGEHYFLCAASWGTSNYPNTLNWTPLNETFGVLGPPLMHHYNPKSGVVQPQGLWATGEIIWFNNSDGSLWQVALADVLANTSGSLHQVSATGIVQAVISDGAVSPNYYVLSAVPNGSSYDLVEFPAGDPDSAVTIQSDWSLGGIKTTPDGAVWKVIPDFNATAPQAQVAILAPSFPSNNQTPTWVDPFANTDPTFCPAGLAQTIMDAVPLSATNILLRTTIDEAADQSPAWAYLYTWQLTRVGIGVLDQPAATFPSYSGDMETAYTDISQALMATQSGSFDIRIQYPMLTAAEANGYYTTIQTLSVPSNFPDPTAWNAVQSDLTTELYNLLWTLSFWEAMGDLVNLRNQLKSQALGYVSNSLSIPTTATLINTAAGTVNALTIAGATAGGVGSILSATAGILGACTFPVGSAIVGVLSAGASLVSLFCSTDASKQTNYVINVSDPMYTISARLGALDGILGQLFAEILTVIGSSVQTCAKDPGILATVGGLVRNGSWLNSPPSVVPGSSTVPQSFDDYYNGCVVSYFQAFVPLVTAVNVIMTNPDAGESWPTYKGKPVYISPTHSFTDSLGQVYNGALLQYAAAHDQSKPLGQDLDALLFTTWTIPFTDVFLRWQIPTKPSWVS